MLGSDAGLKDVDPSFTAPEVDLSSSDAFPSHETLHGIEGLKKARNGDTVLLAPKGISSLSGPLKIPAGVTLKNDGLGEISVKNEGKGACFVVETNPEAYPTRIEGIACEVARGAGIVILGKGRFVGEHLMVRVKAGVGIVADGQDEVTLRDVVIQGEDRPIEARKSAASFFAKDKPLVGLLASRVQKLELENVEVAFFDGIGALLHESKSTWKKGIIANVMGMGLTVQGGEASLERVRIEYNLAHGRGALIAAGLVLVGDAVVDTTELYVGDNEGEGIFQGKARARYSRLEVSSNARFGLRLQAGAVAAIDHATIENNRGAGVFARGASMLSLTASRVVKTRPLRGRTSRFFPIARFGDGLQVVVPKLGSSTSAPRLVLTGVSFVDNARAACLFHGSSDISTDRFFSIKSVRVSGSSAWGVVTQGGMKASPQWRFSVSPALAETPAPGRPLGVSTAMALPKFSGLNGGVIKDDGGLIHEDGTVYIQIDGVSFDPGLGP